MKSIDLTILIVNYNSGHWLEMTLDTLKKFYLDKTNLKVETVIVDNGSTDDSLEMLRKKYKWTKLILSPTNLGFSAGNNLGLRQIKSEYVMLLNSDIEFKSNSNLDDLITYLKSHPKVGAITPKLLLPTGELDLASHRGEPTLWASLTYFLGLEGKLSFLRIFDQYHHLYKNLKSIHEIDACSGAAMILPKKIIDQVGFLDERFFMYAEDLDWCKRIRQQGYQIIYHPGVTLIHHKNKSGIHSKKKQVSSKTKRYFYTTMLQYYDKHYHSKYPNWIRWMVAQLINYKVNQLAKE